MKVANIDKLKKACPSLETRKEKWDKIAHNPDNIRPINEWKYSKIKGDFVCGKCNEVIPYFPSGIANYNARYCPNCGVKMRIEEREIIEE